MTSMTRMTTKCLGGALLLAGLASACGEVPDDQLQDEAALAVTEEVTTILEESAPGQTVFDGVAAPTAAQLSATDPLLGARDSEAATYGASFASSLAAEASTQSADAPATTDSTALSSSHRTVSITGEKQQRPYWCVPASSRITLSALRSNPPTQTTLANRLHTTSDGTQMAFLPAALNAYQSKNHFIFTNTTPSSSNLVTRVRYDIDEQRSPLVPALQGSYLPAWRARGYSGYHAVVIYGWNVATKQPYYLNLYDPLNVSWSGPYNVKASTVYSAMKAEHNELVW